MQLPRLQVTSERTLWQGSAQQGLGSKAGSWVHSIRVGHITTASRHIGSEKISAHKDMLNNSLTPPCHCEGSDLAYGALLNLRHDLHASCRLVH